MQIGSQVVYKDTENSPIFQVVEEPTEFSVVCICVDNGPIGVEPVVLDISDIVEI